RPVAAQKRVAQARFQAVPARRERAGEIEHVLVIHAEHAAERMLLHVLACALGAVFLEPVPIDALLPIKPNDSEIGGAHNFSFSTTGRVREIAPTVRVGTARNRFCPRGMASTARLCSPYICSDY